MSFPIFACVILPLWAAIFALYFILRRAKLSKESLIAKCAGSFLAVSSAGVALFLRGTNPFTQPIFWFFVLCMAADALLELQFVVGMGVFAAGHICLLTWLLSFSRPPWYVILLWAAAYALIALVFRKEIPGLKSLLVPFLLYPAILSAELVVALCLLFTGGAAFLLVALGAVCFYVSDILVAKGVLTKVPSWLHKPTMLLYWASLLLFSAALW